MFNVTVRPSKNRESLFAATFGPEHAAGVPLLVAFHHVKYEDEGPRRGTVCCITSPHRVFRGASRCHPNDKFRRDVGRKVALDDVLFAIPFDHKERRQIWQAYWSWIEQSRQAGRKPRVPDTPQTSLFVCEAFGYEVAARRLR